MLFFFTSRRRHTRWPRDWSSDVCSSDLVADQVDALGDLVGDPVGAGVAVGDRLPDPGPAAEPRLAIGAGVIGADEDRSEERRGGRGGRWRWTLWNVRRQSEECRVRHRDF